MWSKVLVPVSRFELFMDGGWFMKMNFSDRHDQQLPITVKCPWLLNISEYGCLQLLVVGYLVWTLAEFPGHSGQLDQLDLNSCSHIS